MAITTLNEENFNSITSRDGIVMVDCWAEWCEACQSFNPIYEKVAHKYKQYTFAKLDAVAVKELISQLMIEHIPTLLLYRDGILLFQQPGYYEEEKLEDIIHQAEGLDMNEVKAHMAKEKSEGIKNSN